MEGTMVTCGLLEKIPNFNSWGDLGAQQALALQFCAQRRHRNAQETTEGRGRVHKLMSMLLNRQMEL